MKSVQISGGSAVIGQLFLLLFLLPFVLLFHFFAFKKITLDLMTVLLPLDVIVFFIFKNGFSYVDVYSVGDNLILEKMFFKAQIYKDQIIEVDRGKMPNTFYLSSKDNSKFFFLSPMLGLSDGSDEILNKLRDQLFN